jgi:hypothetical protein
VEVIPNVVPSFGYVRLIRTGFFLPSWAALVCRVAGFTAAILRTSALTAAFGLIEPISIGNRFQNKWEMKK